jgi:lipoprotein signal peptidase
VRSPWVRSVAVAGAVVVVDQASKSVAAQHGPVPRNPALALGVAGGPAPVLIVLALAVVVVFLAVVGRLAVRLGIPAMLPAIVAGGVSANAIDRVRFGAVRDFIPLPGMTVNVADFAIAAGIVVLAVALAARTTSRVRRPA